MLDAPATERLVALDAQDHRELTERARAVGEDAGAAVAFAIRTAATLPLPGGGATLRRWSMLAAAARGSLSAARVLEAHADALSILAEAGDGPDAADVRAGWGVYAAESSGEPLRAASDEALTRLSGLKPWCSLAHRLDRALLTAQDADGSRRLYRVDLRDPTVRVMAPEGWVARGLRTVISVGVRFDGTPAAAVGAPGWYVQRNGFAWGGMGVAACWHGGALALLADIVRLSGARRGELADLHIGRAAAALHGSAAALIDAARRIDDGSAPAASGARVALAVRSVVAAACEDVLREAAHALGPGPAAFDPAHAARIADLDLYIRQHHAERDLAALGAMIRGGSDAGQGTA